jgi:hypothetical protein
MLVSANLRRKLAGWIALIAAAAAPIFVVVDSWGGGKPLVFALGGFFPLTDGAMWWTCGLQLAGLGSVPGPFGWVTFDSSGYCTNRPSHTGLLATLQMIAGFDPHVLLLLLALIVGAGMAYLSLEVARTFGWLAAAVTYGLVIAFASQHALSVFTSEATGLFLGLLAVGFLVRFVRTDAWPDALLGITALSIGLFTRAGALLVLPVLLMWIIWQARRLRGRSRYAFLLGGAGCVAAGYLLQRALLVFLGDPSGGHLSNFSVVLYGLATGSRDWREALVLYGVETPAPVETMNIILTMAISKVQEQPGIFLKSLALAEPEYLAALFRLPALEAINSLLIGLLAIGTLCLLLSIRRRGCQLLLLVAAGEALSAPLIFDADGLRVFAATFPIRCVLVAVTVSALSRLLGAAVHRRPMREAITEFIPSTASGTARRAPAAVLAGAVLAMFFAMTPLARPFRLDPLPAGNVACPDQVPPVVVVVNRGSTAQLIAESSATGASGALSVSSLDREIRDAWFREDFAQLPHNTLLLHAIDRNPSNFGRQISLLWMNADPTVRDGDVLRFCLLPHLTRAPHRRFTRLAYHRYFMASPVTVTRSH